MPDSRTTHHVEAGRKGAAKRWGPPRRISIGDLTPDQRRLVLAMIEAERQANAAKAES